MEVVSLTVLLGNGGDKLILPRPVLREQVVKMLTHWSCNNLHHIILLLELRTFCVSGELGCRAGML
jgi:hypothetical protein